MLEHFGCKVLDPSNAKLTRENYPQGKKPTHPLLKECRNLNLPLSKCRKRIPKEFLCSAEGSPPLDSADFYSNELRAVSLFAPLSSGPRSYEDYSETFWDLFGTPLLAWWKHLAKEFEDKVQFYRNSPEPIPDVVKWIAERKQVWVNKQCELFKAQREDGIPSDDSHESLECKADIFRFGKIMKGLLNNKSVDKSLLTAPVEKYLEENQIFDEYKSLCGLTLDDFLMDLNISAMINIPALFFNDWMYNVPEEDVKQRIADTYFNYYFTPMTEGYKFRVMKNFDLNMRFFESLDNDKFNKELDAFLEQYNEFKVVTDLNDYQQTGLYVMVLDEYKQVYIGFSAAEKGIMGSIQQHWNGLIDPTRFLWGNEYTSKISIDSFRHADTGRIFACPITEVPSGSHHTELYAYLLELQEKLIKGNSFSPEFICNRHIGERPFKKAISLYRDLKPFE